MEAWQIFLIIFSVTLLLIIIVSSRKKDRKKQQKSVTTYLDYGDYPAAGRLYLKEKNEADAADLYFRVPIEKRSLYESMIQDQLGTQDAQLFWIKTGRRYEKIDHESAKIAYLLGGAYFDAVKMFIDKNDSLGAVNIVKFIPINLQENVVRKLCQYSFDRGKYNISAQLLQSIGLIDEANAILAVAAHDYRAVEQPEVAANIYDSVGRQDLVGESQEQRGEKALSDGNIEEAKIAFKEAVKAYDESNQPKDALRIEERLKKFALLDKFRECAAMANMSAAEEMIDEIAKSFPGIATSDLYAEIGIVLERNGFLSEAITYFDKAADSTNNPIKKQGYINALRRLGSNISAQVSKGVKIASSDMPDKCIVCKKNIKKGEKMSKCPKCKKLAHHSHIVEWVKVQGSCPNCHSSLKTDDL